MKHFKSIKKTWQPGISPVQPQSGLAINLWPEVSLRHITSGTRKYSLFFNGFITEV